MEKKNIIVKNLSSGEMLKIRGNAGTKPRGILSGDISRYK